MALIVLNPQDRRSASNPSRTQACLLPPYRNRQMTRANSALALMLGGCRSMV
ncbi:MAG: hypothetical protein J2P19_20285 [Pseudonocardia sp.]|nr:hypothetical protein [Pseudonocardia sp.]